MAKSKQENRCRDKSNCEVKDAFGLKKTYDWIKRFKDRRKLVDDLQFRMAVNRFKFWMKSFLEIIEFFGH